MLYFKNILKTSTLLLIVLFVAACTKSSTTQPDLALVVTTNPADGTVLLPQPLGGNLALAVTVTSKMPSKGVKISVVALNETTTTNFYTFSVSNSNTSNTINIANIPVQKTCLCNVKVSSVSDTTNVWNGSFRFSSK